MKEREFHLHDGKTGSAITVRITPRASRNEISEILDDGTIKIRLTAGPGEEQTNKALVAFLAQVLEVKQTQVEIVPGSTGIDKLVTITDMEKGEVQERILKNIA